MHNQADILGDSKTVLSLFRKLSSETKGRVVRSLVFFVLFWLYLWLEVDVRFIYHGGGLITTFPVFYRGWAFFQESVARPGGPVEYLSAFLSQFFYYSWAGAALATVQAWLLCLCTDVFIKAINCRRLRFVRFIPPIVLLVVYTLYTYHFVTTMALLTALAFVCLHLRVRPKNNLADLVVFLALSVIVYTLAGAAYLLFAALCAICELLFRRRWQMAVLYSLSAVTIPYVEGVWLFGGNTIDAFSYLLPYSWETAFIFHPRRIILILYLFLPLIAVTAGFGRLFVGRAGKKVEKHHKKSSKRLVAIFSLYSRNSKLRWVVESCSLFAVAVATIFVFHSKQLKTAFAVDYYACHKNFTQVLNSAANSKNYFVLHAVNRALYHTGRLGRDMFSYPQNPNILLLSIENVLANCKRFDIYIELGQMNMAEHDLTQTLERVGQRPVILERLALINMAKGNITTARVYLGALAKTIFHSDWADNYLDRLDSDPNLSEDKQVQDLRRLMMDEDDDSAFNMHYSNYLEIENMLSSLLKANRQNRMAFEYRMAFYMLTAQLDKLVENIEALKEFDYPRIPSLYEEAILAYSLLGTTKKQPYLHGYQISLQSRQRFRDFIQIYSRYGANKPAARGELAEKYGYSYMIYHLYGTSGMKK